MQQLSPSRLITYQRCPQAYYLRYHRKAPGSVGRQPILGRVLHKCLAQLYDRPAWQGIPTPEEMEEIWQQISCREDLETGVRGQGQEMLRRYYAQFIAPLEQWRQPLGVEGRIEGRIYCQGIEFRLTGRYDRLEYLPTPDPADPAQIHLIDYKSSRTPLAPPELEQDLQMGLYQIAIHQVYGQALRRVSHIYLRTGEVISITPTPQQRQQLVDKVGEIAQTLVQDREFEAKPGSQCRRCGCRAYCGAAVADPLPLGSEGIPLQLSLLA